MKNTPIPNALRFYRKQKKLTQRDVADYLGFKSTDRISRWEKGLTFPHPIHIFKMSVIYSVLPHELYAQLMDNIRTEIID